MTYTAEIKNIIDAWYERERQNWTGWSFAPQLDIGDQVDCLYALAELVYTNDAGWDISDEWDTVSIQNTGQISVTSSYDPDMPLLNAAQLRGLAELSETLEKAIANQEKDRP